MIKQRKRPSLQAKRALLKKTSAMNGTSASSQRQRILTYMQQISPRLTVLEGREILGAMHLPARIFELRKRGYRIDLEWITEFDSLGGKHRNGMYIYQGKRENKNVD